MVNRSFLRIFLSKIVCSFKPDAFRNYPNCRTIIDCTELRCESPGSVQNRVLMHFSYKVSFTIKFLIAISPCGLITFVSKCYGGKSTDG